MRNTGVINIRPATTDDADAIWRILEPVFRAGETYTVPRDIERAEALAYWLAAGNQVFVAEEDANVLAPTTSARTSAVAARTSATVDT